MKSKRNVRFSILLVGVLATSLAQAQKLLTAAEAKAHIGEQATVCGHVVSAHFAARSRGNPTFLNLDKPYPNPVFTVVIWGEDRTKFGSPEVTYAEKQVCATGDIVLYRGTPEIIARDPSQIKAKER
jgi:DNA/RNA endonuclease YhcR with UshA esterase domain